MKWVFPRSTASFTFIASMFFALHLAVLIIISINNYQKGQVVITISGRFGQRAYASLFNSGICFRTYSPLSSQGRLDRYMVSGHNRIPSFDPDSEPSVPALNYVSHTSVFP